MSSIVYIAGERTSCWQVKLTTAGLKTNLTDGKINVLDKLLCAFSSCGSAINRHLHLFALYYCQTKAIMLPISNKLKYFISSVVHRPCGDWNWRTKSREQNDEFGREETGIYVLNCTVGKTSSASLVCRADIRGSPSSYIYRAHWVGQKRTARS